MRSEFAFSVRDFTWKRAMGRCQDCGRGPLAKGQYQFDHIIPDWLGGSSSAWNCKLLCRRCHNKKTSRQDIPRIAKTKRQKRKHEGTWRASRKPVPGSRNSKWKKPLRGKAELRP